MLGSKFDNNKSAVNTVDGVTDPKFIIDHFFSHFPSHVILIMRLFDISRWRPPPSWILKISNFYPRRAFGGLYHCAKFGWNRCSSFGNMHVFRFREFGLKTPI